MVHVVLGGARVVSSSRKSGSTWVLRKLWPNLAGIALYSAFGDSGVWARGYVETFFDPGCPTSKVPSPKAASLEGSAVCLLWK